MKNLRYHFPTYIRIFSIFMPVYTVYACILSGYGCTVYRISGIESVLLKNARLKVKSINNLLMCIDLTPL